MTWPKGLTTLVCIPSCSHQVALEALFLEPDNIEAEAEDGRRNSAKAALEAALLEPEAEENAQARLETTLFR